MLKIFIKSLWNRKGTTLLTILSFSLSVFLLLGIERIRNGTKESFESTISDVDIIAGARSGPLHLLLYSVFRIGDATNNISYETYKQIDEHDDVNWTIPISLGDSHKGHRVVGTNDNYFKHYSYANKKKIAFDEGKPFKELYDVVLGSKVASKLNYKIGQKIVLSHGTSAASFQDHDDKPFKVVGILKPTGTPIDSSLHVSLEAITAIHIDWGDGAPPAAGKSISQEETLKMDLKPSDITAFFIKTKTRFGVFKMQRFLNDYEEEAIMGVLPLITLQQLWGTVGVVENALLGVSAMVFLVSLVGIMISLLATLNEKRREMAIFRSLGAHKSFILSMMLSETLIISVFGSLFGIILLYGSLFLLQPILESEIGITVSLFSFKPIDSIYILCMTVGGLLASIIPSIQLYKKSVADGLTIK